MKPLPSHPGLKTDPLARRRREERRIHLVKWHEMPIRVYIPALLKQVLGYLRRVKNHYYLPQDFNGHNVPYTLLASIRNTRETDCL